MARRSPAENRLYGRSAARGWRCTEPCALLWAIPGQITKVRMKLDTTQSQTSFLIDIWIYPWRWFLFFSNLQSCHFTGSFYETDYWKLILRSNAILCLLFFVQGRVIITANQDIIGKQRAYRTRCHRISPLNHNFKNQFYQFNITSKFETFCLLWIV